MPKSSIAGMLLFSKEIERYPYRYRLYFVEQPSILSSNPKIHRFVVKTRREFQQYDLGSVYTLEYKGLNILSKSVLATQKLDDESYFKLVESRDINFHDERSQKKKDLTADSYQPANYYYNFETQKSLLEYDPTKGHKITVAICKIIVYSLSFVVPMLLYLLYLFLISSYFSRNPSGNTEAFALPLLAIGTFPFVVWLMSSIHVFCEALMLSIEFFRYDILKSYTLKWAGLRKSCYIEPVRKRKLIRHGIITFSIMLLTLFLVFIVL